jgi:diacylglycerol kinase (ATP)
MKPKYNFFKNTGYAISGLVEVFQSEKSFRMHLLAFVIFSAIALLLPVEALYKWILILSMIPNFIVELINSAIERTVDLVTDEYHPLAKKAKDAAAAAVMITILFATAIWVGVIYFSVVSR